MDGADLFALGVVVVLAAAHAVAPMLEFIEFRPRSWVLSAAGGVSVAYVFVHLLPEVAEAQEAVDERTSGLLGQIESHAYLAALVGLGVYYGVEAAAVRSRRRMGDDEEGGTHGSVFWLGIASFAVYNAIIGYLVVRRAEDDAVLQVLVFALALGLHFIVNDLGLRDHHRRRYDRVGRPVLVAAIVAGWLLGIGTQVSEAAIGLVVAFLGGGIILNVIKEELPDERESRFLPLAGGAIAYSALLLLV